jgi:oxidase EvaA
MVLKESIFLKSALTEDNPFIKTGEVINWLKVRNEETRVNISRVNFQDLDQWYIDQTEGRIRHHSGKFFSIDGISVKTNWGAVSEWQQPIINQPEIGILGILTKEFNGILYFLMQAKIEPGNVNYVQLSPTLQATKSNYTQIHHGRKPLYLDYFLKHDQSEILLDQLQSEQGARFLKKRNRNIIIKVNTEIEPHPDFIWLTLGQLKKLIQFNNLVNMDTRTVISGIPFGSYDSQPPDFFNTLNPYNSENNYRRELLYSALIRGDGLHSIDSILNWFTNLKSQCEIEVERIPLFSIKQWLMEKDQLRHIHNKYFKVIAVQIEIGNREVIAWSQPLVQPMQEGLIAFIVKKINGIYHFLVQAKLESGNYDILEFAPTVQCLTGNYRDTKENTLPFLKDVLNADKSQIRFDTYQSEEGGRFYREQNHNMIIEAGDDFPLEVPENYIWVTLNQLNQFLKFNNYLNIQARSLISSISFI